MITQGLRVYNKTRITDEGGIVKRTHKRGVVLFAKVKAQTSEISRTDYRRAYTEFGTCTRRRGRSFEHYFVYINGNFLFYFPELLLI